MNNILVRKERMIYIMDNILSKKREINFELLRIILMIFIIIHHLTINALGLSNIIDNKIVCDFNKYSILSFIECFTVIGVNVFFLISGYFGIKLKMKKMFILMFDLYFYSTIIRIIGLLLGVINFDHITINEIIVPFNTYWFMLAYILLMIFSPYLNILINNISKKQYLMFVIIICLVFGIFDFLTDNFIIRSNNGYSLISAIYMYIIGGGVKKFDIVKSEKEKNKFLITYVVLCIINFLISLIGIYIIKDGNMVWRLYSYNNILNILSSIALLRYFKRVTIKEKYNNLILWISPSVLAVYFLHSSSWLGKIRNMPLVYLVDKVNIVILVMLMIVYSIFIFVICIIIDKIKKKLFDRYILKFIEYIDRKFIYFKNILEKRLYK